MSVNRPGLPGCSVSNDQRSGRLQQRLLCGKTGTRRPSNEDGAAGGCINTVTGLEAGTGYQDLSGTSGHTVAAEEVLCAASSSKA